MSEASEKPAPKERRLSDAIRDVKNAAADREDVVVEMRELQKTRLDLLAAELAQVFADVPGDIDLFDFAISAGAQPRLWIDAVSHVTMGRDRRTYRFLKDTRLGRVVLAESSDPKPVADQVSRYIAERMIERERLMEGPVEPVLAKADPETTAEPKASRGSSALSVITLIVAGALFGVGAAALLLWEQISANGISF